ncbi:MAG: DUF2911 domain-containing protein [Bacteroidota bacterium]
MKNYISIILMLCTASVFAQSPLPTLSFHGSIKQEIGALQLQIDYERPCVRDRVIFGDLVPYGKIWRTAAGKGVRLSVNRPVKLGGQSIDAGVYSLLSIPEPDQWTIIINRDTSLYGHYGYDIQQDAARFVVPVQKAARHYEALTIEVDVVPHDAVLYIAWDDVQVQFPIETGIDQEVQTFVKDSLLSGAIKDPSMLAFAAEILQFNNQELMTALQLTELAAQQEEHGWHWSLKTTLLERLGRIEEALQAAEGGKAYVAKTTKPSAPHYAEDIARWQVQIDKLTAKMRDSKN